MDTTALSKYRNAKTDRPSRVPKSPPPARSPEPRSASQMIVPGAGLKSFVVDVHTWGSVRYTGLFGCLAAMFLLTGCADFTMTNPPRTYTEQLLLSTAADRALRSADLGMFQGKKVFFDFTYFDSYDPKYVQGALRDTFSQAGAEMAADAAHSDYTVEARSGAYSIDYSSSLIGIPPFGLPIPLAGTISTPELAFYKSSKQDSLAKFALLAYDTKSRDHFYSSGPMVGKAFNNNHKVFGFLWVSSDIPEKKKAKN